MSNPYKHDHAVCHCVTEAVAQQVELDLLAEFTDLLDSEHGPVSGEFLAEAGSAWPDAEQR